MLDLDAELEICQAATAGPWFQWTACGDVSSEPEDCAIFFSCKKQSMPDGSTEHTPQGEADCIFLVHARTNYPAALEALKAIQALCEGYNHPGVNTGAHGLAGEVLAILGGE